MHMYVCVYALACGKMEEKGEEWGGGGGIDDQ